MTRHEGDPTPVALAKERAALDVFGFPLTAADMSAIARLDTGTANRRMPRWLQKRVFPQFRARQLP